MHFVEEHFVDTALRQQSILLKATVNGEFDSKKNSEKRNFLKKNQRSYHRYYRHWSYKNPTSVNGISAVVSLVVH